MKQVYIYIIIAVLVIIVGVVAYFVGKGESYTSCPSGFMPSKQNPETECCSEEISPNTGKRYCYTVQPDLRNVIY